MTNITKLMAKLAVAVGLIGGLAFGAVTPSLAAGSHYYEPGDNGSVWSDYPGYTDHTARRPSHLGSAYGAYAQAPTTFSRGRVVDDPPGSAFQTRGNEEAMGCPC
jgi:hypothetical protein